jgi:2-(1,2-epoxy-1,2-dihydrophenyl)acetyl-CoA isomerase
MNYDTILFSSGDGVARITLNRPERLNAFSEQLHEDLRDAIGTVRADASVRVLLLTGAGRGFCAGQDLSERAPLANGETRDLSSTLERNYLPLILSLRALEIPVIGAVNGVAAGAGVSLALACDIVLAAKSASFVLAFAKLGLVPDAGATYFLPRLIGPARALAVSMLGERISAEQAAQWGMIWRCVEDGELAAEAGKLAQHFACAPTRGVARTKQVMDASLGNGLREQLGLEGKLQSELGRTQDYAEGVRAFLEKRAPNFVGA